MSQIIVTAVLTPLVLLGAGALLARRARQQNKSVSAAQVILLFAAVFSAVFIVLGVALYSLGETDRSQRSLIEANAVTSYVECRRSVDDSVGDRKFDEFLLDILGAVQTEVDVKSNGQIHLDALDQVRDEGISFLDAVNPARTYDECPGKPESLIEAEDGD